MDGSVERHRGLRGGSGDHIRRGSRGDRASAGAESMKPYRSRPITAREPVRYRDWMLKSYEIVYPPCREHRARIPEPYALQRVVLIAPTRSSGWPSDR